MELAAQIEHVGYYDDSGAITPEGVIEAIRTFDEPTVLILGVSDQLADYAGLAHIVENEGVIHVFIVGSDTSVAEQALRAEGFSHLTTGYESMDKLVRDCYAVTEPGDIVLFSPGCVLAGIFKDNYDFGNQFKAAARKLQEVSDARKP